MNHCSGVELASLPLSLQAHVSSGLRPGETIRWLGRPGKESPAFFLFMMMLGAFNMVVFIGLIAALVSSAGFFWVGVGAVLFIVMLAFLSVPCTYQRMRHTAYVVTDQRAVIVEQSIWFFPPMARNRFQVASYGPTKMKTVTRRNYADGFGDLVFETRRYSHGDGRDHTEDIGFLKIPDVEMVESLLRDLAGGKRSEPPASIVSPADESQTNKPTGND